MALKKTRNNIIEQALQKIGVIGPDEQASDGSIQSGAIELDYLVKSWQSTGAHLWSEEQGILFLQPGQEQYILGPNSTDRAAQSENDVKNTTLTADAATSATVLTVASEADIAVSDNIGILLDTDVLFFTTVVSLSPLTITTGLPSAASSGRVVWTYTEQISKPLKIPASRRNQGGITGITGQDITMTDLGREDYYDLPEKSTKGVPTQYYYQPNIDDGNIRIWPSPENSLTFLRFTFWRPINVFDNSSSAPDFPNEWLFALVYNLAVNLMPNFGVDPNRYPTVTALAGNYLNTALNWDSGTGDIMFQYAKGRGQ